MKNPTYTALLLSAALLALAACAPESRTIRLTYRQHDIQKQFDTLYNGQQTGEGFYKGFLEQALATCHGEQDSAIRQDVLSSMYLDTSANIYHCITNTVFSFPGGTVNASGVFNMVPGDTIAPDHDFPVTGGSAGFAGVSGRYTRRYNGGVYYVELELKE